MPSKANGTTPDNFLLLIMQPIVPIADWLEAICLNKRASVQNQHSGTNNSVVRQKRKIGGDYG